MDAGRSRFDHGLHQFESIEIAAESGFGVGDERREPVHFIAVGIAIAAFGVMDLIGTHERLINAAYKVWDAVCGIEALVGIHLSSIVGVGGNLPSAYVDGLQSGLDLLDGLVPGGCTERGNERF